MNMLGNYNMRLIDDGGDVFSILVLDKMGAD